MGVRARWRPPRARICVAIAVGSIALGAGSAYAALHTTNNVVHGITSSQNCGLGCGRPRASADNLNNYKLVAGMYHLRDDGGWNQQCATPPMTIRAACDGDWGTAPCRKYAWTKAYTGQEGGLITVYMNWHGMNSEATLCNA